MWRISAQFDNIPRVMFPPAKPPVEILLIEDSQADVRLIEDFWLTVVKLPDRTET